MDKTKQFALWLDGFLEGEDRLDSTKTEILKNRLDSLFEHTADKLGEGKTLIEKPTLEELGQEHGFHVTTNQGQISETHNRPGGNGLMRC